MLLVYFPEGYILHSEYYGCWGMGASLINMD